MLTLTSINFGLTPQTATVVIGGVTYTAAQAGVLSLSFDINTKQLLVTSSGGTLTNDPTFIADLQSEITGWNINFSGVSGQYNMNIKKIIQVL